MKNYFSNLQRTVSYVLIGFLLSAVSANAQSFPPSNVTNTQDRDQMMSQLGITFPILPVKTADTNRPAGAYPKDPNNIAGDWTDSLGLGNTITVSGWGLWNNYGDRWTGLFPGRDSNRVGNYTPIDLLKMKNGTLITTADDWWNLRRPEIYKDITQQFWGVIPPDSVWPKITWSVSTTTGGTGNSAYIQRTITGFIDSSRYPGVRNVPRISAYLRVPASALGKVPVMVVFNPGFGAPTSALDTYWNYANPNGWGACIYDQTVLQPDNGAGLTSYIIGLINKGNWRKPTDWGALVAWSWGVSRLIDYFETDSLVNATKIGLSGHSRYGKATLVAMAYEPRLAIAYPSCGGSLGTKMNRRHWGQDMENSASYDQEYHWMAGAFMQWAGPLTPGTYLPRKIELCPVDAHSLLSLCAPRPVFLNGGYGDTWTDPYGIFLTCIGATPVYQLLGKQGLVSPDAKPQLDVAYISGDVGYRYHHEGHTDAPDWPSFFQFAKKYIVASTLSLGTTSLTLKDSANSHAVVHITSDTTWSVSSSESWLQVNRTSGSHNDTLTVTAQNNLADSIRVAIVSISVPGFLPQTITVAQTAANPARLALSDTALVIGASLNSTATFAITSNTQWYISFGRAFSWLTANPSSDMNNRVVTITASNNPTSTPRVAYITVSGTDAPSITIPLTQAGIPTTVKSGNINEFIFDLSQNYPNPFNPSTTISFTLEVSGFTTLKIYDILGREVATLVHEVRNAGNYSIQWDATNISSGIYFYRLETNTGFAKTKKLLLLK
jgi:hypothetical protein